MNPSFIISMIVFHTFLATCQVAFAVHGRGNVAISLFFMVFSIACIAYFWVKLLERVQ